MIFTLMFDYIGWHYTKAYKDIVSVWKNFLQFFYNFFSIKVLLATLFSPLKKMHEERKPGLNFEDLFSVLLVNTIMRLVGLLVKSIIIIIGTFVILVVFILGLAVLIAWAFLPIFLIVSIITGVQFII